MTQYFALAGDLSSFLACPKFTFQTTCDLWVRTLTELRRALRLTALTPLDVQDVSSSSGIWRGLAAEDRVPAALLAADLLVAGFADRLREDHPVTTVSDSLNTAPNQQDSHILTQEVLIRKPWQLVTVATLPPGISKANTGRWLYNSPLGWLLSRVNRREQSDMGIPIKKQLPALIYVIDGNRLSTMWHVDSRQVEPSAETRSDWRLATAAYMHGFFTPATGQRCYTCPYPCEAGINYRTRNKK